MIYAYNYLSIDLYALDCCIVLCFSLIIIYIRVS